LERILYHMPIILGALLVSTCYHISISIHVSSYEWYLHGVKRIEQKIQLNMVDISTIECTLDASIFTFVVWP